MCIKFHGFVYEHEPTYEEPCIELTYKKVIFLHFQLKNKVYNYL